MFVAQIFNGEWFFDVEGRQKLLGAEFAAVSFTLGQLLFFFGCSIGTQRQDRKGLYYYLTVGNGFLTVGAFVALFLPVAIDYEWSLTWPAFFVAWGGMVVLGVILEKGRLATRRDD